jgi:hypothetical protein
MKPLPIFGITFISKDGSFSVQPIKAATPEKAIEKFMRKFPTATDTDCIELESQSKLFRLWKSQAI